MQRTAAAAASHSSGLRDYSDREAAFADTQRLITILSVYSSHTKEQPLRLIGWKRVRRVRSRS